MRPIGLRSRTSCSNNSLLDQREREILLTDYGNRRYSILLQKRHICAFSTKDVFVKVKGKIPPFHAIKAHWGNTVLGVYDLRLGRRVYDLDRSVIVHVTW